MNKAVSFIWKFISLIVTLVGIIGMAQSAREFIYRRPPSLDFMFQEDFLALIKTDRDRQFFESLTAPDMVYGAVKTPAKVLDELTQIIDKYPNYIKGYYFRGQLFFSMGRIKDGIEDMGTVIKESKDLKLRRQAKMEIAFARLAQILTPLPFLGLAGIALLIISDFIGIKALPSRRLIRVCVVAFLLWVLSFMLLFLH